jgi:hypothetical protein
MCQCPFVSPHTQTTHTLGYTLETVDPSSSVYAAHTCELFNPGNHIQI